MRPVLIILALVFAGLFFLVPPARSAEVTPELVCTVQGAIRWSRTAWKPRRCSAVAEAMNATAAPDELLAIAVLESGLSASGIAWHRGGTVADVGLCGVRCLLGKNRRCANWPVRGMTVRRLMDPATNIRAAARILAWKRRLCGEKAHDCYVGNPSGRKGRTGHVRALLQAFVGIVVPVKTKRVRQLATKIAGAVNKEKVP